MAAVSTWVTALSAVASAASSYSQSRQASKQAKKQEETANAQMREAKKARKAEDEKKMSLSRAAQAKADNALSSAFRPGNFGSFTLPGMGGGIGSNSTLG